LKDILLLTPPFTQINTPYPATSYLKGFLNTQGLGCFQVDLGIEVFHEIFSKEKLPVLFETAKRNDKIVSENAQRIYALKEAYFETIDSVKAFLQGKDQTLARLICGEDYLPKGSRFGQDEDLEWSFGVMGFQDKAKYLSTLYLEDLSDFIVECIDEDFGFSRYAERLGLSANSFDDLYTRLQRPASLIDDLTLKLLDEKLKRIQPKLVGISVPFPGNLFSGFRCAQYIRKNYPEIVVAMGGGFPNTELRSLTDARVFDFLDYITLDDGALPLELLAAKVLGTSGTPQLQFKRTFLKENGQVVFNNQSPRSDYKQAELGTPDYSDLLLDRYVSVIEVTNPMHSLWSDGRWNKLTMAHGCYWGKCTFCDGSLSYIRDFEPATAGLLVDRMEQLAQQTGERGFHFVDEAAPPALMAALALEILRRKLTFTWWTNIRFEKSFTPDLCKLLKASGCIAVSGGLEVASDRLLSLINKGVTVEQVARVTDSFTQAGIMVHAYLMYGFPSETTQETIDSLEMVRQLFELGIIQSGFWHQFALTAHSPVGQNSDKYGIVPEYRETSFARNDIQFKDKTGIDHSRFSFGLKKSLLNFMNGIGFDLPLQDWFDFRVPKTTIKKDFILRSLDRQEQKITKPSDRIVWLGGVPQVKLIRKIKKGQAKEMLQMIFYEKAESYQIVVEPEKGKWLLETLRKLSVQEKTLYTFSQLKEEFEKLFDDFELFWYSKSVNMLRVHGLLVIL